MNKILQTFARLWLKENLAKRPANQQHFFKRLYSHKDLDQSIDKIVDNMSENQLDWAMVQVDNSMTKEEQQFPIADFPEGDVEKNYRIIGKVPKECA